MFKRVIPIVLLDDEDAIKTVQFQNPNYVGDPINILKIFNEKDADEVIFLDIKKTLSGEVPNFEFLKELASEAFIPVAYGGGIQSFEHASKILMSGYEKVIIQTSLLKFDLCEQITKSFGSQALVGAVDILERNKYKIGEQEFSLSEIKQVITSANCGELMIQNIQADGKRCGFDQSLIEDFFGHFDIPIIYAGGISSNENIDELLKLEVSGVGCGAHFVYAGTGAVLISYYRREY